MDTPMRNGRDRLRYVISFELLLLALVVPVGAIYFDKPLHDIGGLGAILTVKAMVINYLYNLGFDHLDARSGRISSNRSKLGRVFHALGLEITLLITSLPLYMWWLQLGLLQALATDVTVTTFVVFYTFLFTLGYDRMFPVRVAA